MTNRNKDNYSLSHWVSLSMATILLLHSKWWCPIGCHSVSLSSSYVYGKDILNDNIYDILHPHSYTKSPLSNILHLRGGGGNRGTKQKKSNNRRNHKTKSTKTQLTTDMDFKISGNESHNHLPNIEAILIPRKISIPRSIRLVSSILFTSSLLECLRTSGAPFTNAVVNTLLSHGIKPQYDSSTSTTKEYNGDSIHKNMQSSSWKQVSSFDIYMAQKIASSSLSSNNPISLPPPFLPLPIPFIGLIISLFLYFGMTILFPIWFIHFETWLNYIKVNVYSNGINGDISKTSFVTKQSIREIQSYLQSKTLKGDMDDEYDHYYKSQLINRPIISNHDESCTGLAVLVHLSKFDQEMGEEHGKSHVIQWLYRESGDENDIPQFYIELNKRRIYVDINISEKKQEHFGDETYYKITTKCRDGSPTFYKTETIEQLHSRLYNGIIHSSLSNSKSKHKFSKPSKHSLQLLERYQNQFEKYNKLSLPIPTIWQAFVARISSPLSIMQFLGKLLSILEDDSLAPSILNILSTLGRYYWGAKKSIVSATELAKEIQGNVEDDAREDMYWTLRPVILQKKKESKREKKASGFVSNDMKVDIVKNQWTLLPSSKILPGDVFCYPPNSINKSQKQKISTLKTGTLMPVDALLLEGSCVALESVITGESVPQAKVSLDVGQPNNKLCLDTIHRASTLFAGTTIMQFANDSISSKKRDRLPRLPNKYIKSIVSSMQPVKCLALRTGSYSSKGEIVRALSKSKGHSGSITTSQSEKDSIRLISVLSGFALVACATLFIPALQLRTGSKCTVTTFRRVIQCTRIAVASIPSDLPLALTYVAQSSSTKLKKDADVVCAEPGALLTASQIDMIVFDKTGTLTSDTQRLKMIVPPPLHKKNETEYSKMTNLVLAGCHSLLSMNKNKNGKSVFVGDPLDIASLEYSGWNFDSKAKSASSNDVKQNTIESNSPTMLWQLKTFPFDATRRRSSALVLALHGNEFRLWHVMKGSPDGIAAFLQEENKDAYMQKKEKLGSQGLRVIAMAIRDVSNDQNLIRNLFPQGFLFNRNSISTDIISYSREIAKNKVSINDIESIEAGSFHLVGFSCFDTVIRPSSKRVINDLRISGTRVCMLTGDAPEAALSVAKQCGFYDKKSSKNIFLDINENGGLVWTLASRKKTSLKTQINFCYESVKHIIKEAEQGVCNVVMTGKAFDFILQVLLRDEIDDKHIACMYFLQNLSNISIIISRSSPDTKQRVVSTFKNTCDMNVMMCGDGVNDIAAMKTADISAALLTGFGKEVIETGNFDIENERRKSKLMQRPIGNNRMSMTRGPRRKLSRDEKRVLEKGGAAAARMLARDDILRTSIESKTRAKGDSNHEVDDMEIKPGEASLAAPFTFLRPCIDGAESILRSGIATAAFSLSCHRSIALNSLMACFNLATLYRHGFRYGKYMWNVELSLMMAMDQGQHEVSSSPRPKLSIIRPHQSIFHPSSAVSILLQAICHLFILSYSHHAATVIEKRHGESFKHGVTVRLSNPELFGPVGELFKSCTVSHQGESRSGFFGRRRFIPNMISNTVFIISCFQNTIIGLVNHVGIPYNGHILESSSFCFWLGASILFCIITATESCKPLNTILELSKFPNKQSKLLLLLLMIFDGTVSLIIDRLCIYCLDRDRWNAMMSPIILSKATEHHAADLEERLLREERRMNKNMLIAFGCVALWLTMQSFIP